MLSILFGYFCWDVFHPDFLINQIEYAFFTYYLIFYYLHSSLYALFIFEYLDWYPNSACNNNGHVTTRVASLATWYHIVIFSKSRFKAFRAKVAIADIPKVDED